MGKKRGQITTFIVVGLIILLFVGSFFFIRNVILRDVEPGTIVPPDYREVNDFVESCLTDVSTDAILILGEQGGYIEMPNRIKNDYFSYLKPIPGGLITVPYWYYLGENRVPTITEMEADISIYVQDNLKDCLNNFTSFNDKFSITAGELRSNVIIGEKDVQSKINYPLTIRKLDVDESTEIENFVIKLDVRLKKIYELADAIYREENLHSFLDNTTLDLMVIHPDIPFSDMKLECNRMQWSKSSIIWDLKNMMYYNMPRIKVKNTVYIPHAENRNYQKNKFVWDINGGPEEMQEMSVSFSYHPSWPLDLEVRPTEGDILKSNVGQGLQQYLHFFCINIYHFTYDVQFPILVTVKDTKSFDGNGFSFNYAIPIMINHNKPERKNYLQQDFRVPDKGGDFCLERTNKKILVKVVNEKDGFTMDGVNVSYDCVNKRCYLGETAFDGLDYELSTTLPSACTGGEVVVEHPNILTQSKQIFIDNMNDGEMVRIPISEMIQIPFEVLKHDTDNPVFSKDITGDEKAIIAISSNQTDYSDFKMYPPLPGQENLKLFFSDHSYYFDILLLDNEDNLIGGFKYDWNVSYDELADANLVQFQVLEQIPHPDGYEEERNLVAMLQNYSYPPSFMPKFVTENENE